VKVAWDPEALQRDLRLRHPSVTIYLSGRKIDKDMRLLTLSMIRVPKDERGHGTGTEIMKHILAYADVAQAFVALSPDGTFGTSAKRLRSWYKSLGFVDNKGRSRELRISESMYREPRP